MFLLYVIDIDSEYAWVVPLKDKKGITITNTFQKVLDESRCKPKKIWLNKGSEFYNRLMKLWLKKWCRNIFNTWWKNICCCWKIY